MAGADEIEMEFDVLQQKEARGALAAEDAEGEVVEFAEVSFDDGLVEEVFAFEIVVEECLVDAGLGGDGVCAGAGETIAGEDGFGGGEDFEAGALGAEFLGGAGGFTGDGRGVAEGHVN